MSLKDLDLSKETGIDQSTYEPPTDFYRPLEPGTYMFTRVDFNPEEDFGATRNGDLQAKLQLKVQGGARDGETHYENIFTTPSNFRPSTSADDYIRACGGVVASRRTQDYVDAITANPGPFSAVIGRWRGYCRNCEENTIGRKGQPKFPLDAEGNLVHVMDCPQCGEKVGAQAQISRYVIPEA